jgi:DNA-binding PadR family transcriptional regulator
MKLLTRSEEYVLLAVSALGDDAYSHRIQSRLSEITGYEWSLGSIYSPLERLEKRGLLTSSMTEPTPERGGRPKRVYTLTEFGHGELERIRAIHSRMWQGAGERLGLSGS